MQICLDSSHCTKRPFTGGIRCRLTKIKWSNVRTYEIKSFSAGDMARTNFLTFMTVAGLCKPTGKLLARTSRCSFNWVASKAVV